jgi:O-antigen/teichoic acid export membrane protein
VNDTPRRRAARGAVPPDQGLLRVARGGALNIVAAIVNHGCSLAVLFALARATSAAGVGRYAQAYAALALLGLASVAGLRPALTRFVAIAAVDRDDAARRGAARLGIGIATAIAVGLAGALALGAGPIARGAFGEAALIVPLRLVAATLPFFVFWQTAASVLQGAQRHRSFAVVEFVLEPGLRFGLTLVALASGAGLRGALVALLAANAITAVVAGRLVHGLIGRGAAPLPVRSMVGFASSMWLANSATTGLIWADTLLIGILRESADVGIYQVATRVVMLAAFVMAPLNSAVAPRAAALHRLGDDAGLRHLYRAATGWMMRLALPAFVTLLVFAPEVLNLFGDRYTEAAWVTRVLALGKLVDVATGPCGVLLQMTGHALLNVANNIVTLVVNVGLNLWWIPAYGLRGAALAWAFALVGVNTARVVQVRRIVGSYPFDTTLIKAALACGAQVLFAVNVSYALDGSGALIIGTIGGAFLYVAASWASGIGPAEIAAFRSLAPRRAGPRPAAVGSSVGSP